MLRDLIRRSFWLALGAAIGRLLPLAVLLLASRWMETRQFASASAGYAWAGVAMSLTSAGLATVMTQRLAASADATVQAGLFAHHLRLSIAWASAVGIGGARVRGTRRRKHLRRRTRPARSWCPRRSRERLWSQVAVCVAALNGCHRARAASLALAACGLLQGAGMAVAIHFIGADAKRWPGGCSPATRWPVALRHS